MIINNNKPPIWEWFKPTIYGDDWGMVYYCYTAIPVLYDYEHHITIMVFLAFSAHPLPRGPTPPAE